MRRGEVRAKLLTRRWLLCVCCLHLCCGAQVLGGNVEALVTAWQTQRQYGGLDRSALSGEDKERAPPFRQFMPGEAARRGRLLHRVRVGWAYGQVCVWGVRPAGLPSCERAAQGRGEVERWATTAAAACGVCLCLCLSQCGQIWDVLHSRSHRFSYWAGRMVPQ